MLEECVWCTWCTHNTARFLASHVLATRATINDAADDDNDDEYIFFPDLPARLYTLRQRFSVYKRCHIVVLSAQTRQFGDDGIHTVHRVFYKNWCAQVCCVVSGLLGNIRWVFVCSRRTGLIRPWSNRCCVHTVDHRTIDYIASPIPIYASIRIRIMPIHQMLDSNQFAGETNANAEQSRERVMSCAAAPSMLVFEWIGKRGVCSCVNVFMRSRCAEQDQRSHKSKTNDTPRIEIVFVVMATQSYWLVRSPRTCRYIQYCQKSLQLPSLVAEMDKFVLKKFELLNDRTITIPFSK